MYIVIFTVLSIRLPGEVIIVKVLSVVFHNEKNKMVVIYCTDFMKSRNKDLSIVSSRY